MSATDNTDHVGSNLVDKGWTIGGPLLAATAAITYASLWVGYTINGQDTAGLFADARGLRADWTPASTITAVCLCAALAAAYWVIRRGRTPKDSHTGRMDRAGAYLATDKELAGLTTKGRAKAAKRKHITAPALPHTFKTLSGQWIDVGPESTATMIAGPRGGKTSAAAVTRIAEWTGPVVVTSNKRDLVDITRNWRQRDGARAWVFDPQRIIEEPASWYWNPISYVAEGDPDKMDMRAASLAHRFAFSGGTSSSKSGEYFSQTGEGLIGSLILAAACNNGSILDILDWITDRTDQEPVRLLRKGGFDRIADKLASTIRLTDQQKDGIYGTAETMTEFLTFKSSERWVTPGRGRTEFHPHDFVRSHDTLYSISREGQGSMGPLVTALTVAVCEAAEDLAQFSPAGRLATPMALVLDEVANVCRWADLPNVYSHYGSKGIIPIAFFQSWSQGAAVWGDQGMHALWSASTSRILGPGVDDAPFISNCVDMIGDYTKLTRSRSHSKDGSSTSYQNTREHIFDKSDLTSIPEGRVVVFEAAHPPAYLKTVGWFERDYAKDLKATVEKPEVAA